MEAEASTSSSGRPTSACDRRPSGSPSSSAERRRASPSPAGQPSAERCRRRHVAADAAAGPEVRRPDQAGERGRGGRRVAQAEEQAQATVAQAEEQARQVSTEAEHRLREEVTRLEGMRGQLATDVENMARHLESERNRLALLAGRGPEVGRRATSSRRTRSWRCGPRGEGSTSGSAGPPASDASPAAGPVATPGARAGRRPSDRRRRRRRVGGHGGPGARPAGSCRGRLGRAELTAHRRRTTGRRCRQPLTRAPRLAPQVSLWPAGVRPTRIAVPGRSGMVTAPWAQRGPPALHRRSGSRPKRRTT